MGTVWNVIPLLKFVHIACMNKKKGSKARRNLTDLLMEVWDLLRLLEPNRRTFSKPELQREVQRMITRDHAKHVSQVKSSNEPKSDFHVFSTGCPTCYKLRAGYGFWGSAIRKAT